MKIREFEESSVQEEIKRYLKNRTLIPMLGSGFTRGCTTLNGTVPSGMDMKQHMKEMILEKFPNAKIPNEFSKIASSYDKNVDKSKRNKYIRDNFIGVQLEEEKNNFLSIEWPYIYTLNIDDAIEESTGLQIILPNKSFDEEFINNNRCIFKLHGDAKNVVIYNTDEKIFTQREYLNSLRSNAKLLDLLLNDLISNNMMFIGCSLDDEIDLLTIADKIKSSSGIRNKVYFITTDELDEYSASTLEEYGITDVLHINDYIKFYVTMYNIYKNSQHLEENEVKEFFNLKVIIEDSDYNNNVEYLFNSQKEFESIENKKIKVPKFYIERDEVKSFIKHYEEYAIHVVQGNRISGKTNFLISIINKVKEKDTYFFPSNVKVNQLVLEKIIKQTDCILLFDTNSIDGEQFKYLYDMREILGERRTKVVFCINTSDKELLTTINFREENINTIELKNTFSKTEVDLLNSKLSLLDIPVFDVRLSILDNLIKLSKQISTENKYKIPVLNRMKIEELVIMIILATKESLTSGDVVKFDLLDDIGKFHSKVTPAIQYEYTKWFEKEGHSGHKIIPNAKYWLLHTLGEYAYKYGNQKTISKAYKYISNCLRARTNDDKTFYKNMSKFINFDVINEIFPRQEKGSAGLISKIYEVLHDDLANDPQYFHQRAKSIYWLRKDDESKLIEALKYVDKSLNDTIATKDILNDNIKNSISHIEFTRALILGRLCNVTNYSNEGYIDEALIGYNKALNDNRNRDYALKVLRKAKQNYRGADFRKLIEYCSKNIKQYKSKKDLINELYKLMLIQ